MDYVISGGLGFIGVNLATELSTANKEFTILDKLSGCDLTKVDIMLPDCKTFVHLAAQTSVRKSFSKSRAFIIHNCLSTLRCLDYARIHDSHFIFASSMGAPQSLSPYSASKLACEACCTAYRESFGLRTTVLRLSNVYGPHSLHKTSVIAKFIKNCLDKQPLTIFGNGHQTRDFVYIDDVVEAIISCKAFVGYKTINVASGIPTSISYVTSLIRQISSDLTGFKPEIMFKPSIKGEIHQINPKTDIKSKIPLGDGLTRTFKWFMEHYAGKRLE